MLLFLRRQFFFKNYLHILLNLEYENENMGLDYEDQPGLDYEDHHGLDFEDQPGELYSHFCNSKV